MQKILRKYRSLKNKKRNRRTKILFRTLRFHNDGEYFEIPEYTMKMIESSIANLKRGIVYGPIDLSRFYNFIVNMGIPEMKKFWLELEQKVISGKANKNEQKLYKRLGKALKFLAQNPRHPGLHTHEIKVLTD